MDSSGQIRALLQQAVAKGLDPQLFKDIPEINIEDPKQKQLGDFSTNIALILGQKAKIPPLKIAQQIHQSLINQIEKLSLQKIFERIEVKPPGFINFFLAQSYLCQTLLEIAKQGKGFGRSALGKGQKVLLEFVSANPTGPLNVAHGRQAAFGDSLANILEFCGYRVSREYYLNDEGTQIEILGDSLYAKYLALLGEPAEFPASGYRGKYIEGLAEELLQKYGRKLLQKGRQNKNFFADFAVRQILKGIKQDLLCFGVKFDSWFSQKKLNKSGRIDKILKVLKERGFLYQKEGAWWLATTRFGDDKDRVAIKSDSSFTYITPDIAYHQDKFKRGFTKCFNVWGPDHHGYIGRMKAVIQALGYDPNCLEILIVQLASLSQAEQIIPMSTRMGQFISLHDIIQAVGKDAARFFFLMRKRDAHLQFDLELAKKQSLENPVYYIQYAHARILNILKFAQKTQQAKIKRNIRRVRLSLLTQPEELTLLKTLRNFPSIIESCALNLEPHRISAYLQDLAKDFHHYYERHKVVTDEAQLTLARLALIEAVATVLGNGLRLLGVSAPEKM